MIKRLILVLILTFSAMAVPSLADTSSVVVVPVADQSVNVRTQAFAQALTQTLVRLSGDSAILTKPAIKKALKTPDNYVLSYGYSTQPVLTLQITMDEQSIKQFLQKNNVPVWNGNRPLILVWVQLENQDPPIVLTQTDQANPWVQALQQASVSRGVSVLLPAMDLQDESSIEKTDSFSQGNLQALASRYAAKAVLAGHVINTPDNKWQGNWTLLCNNQLFPLKSFAATPTDLLQDILNKAVNQLAKPNAAGASQQVQAEVVLLQATDVQNLDQYAQLLAYLRQLSPVKQVTVDNMQDSSVTVQVLTEGGAEALKNALKDSHNLLEVPSNLSAGTQGAELYYQWQPATQPS